jgi:phage FluMu gp28-like protein
LLAEAQTKVLACGRRWGKTEACAVMVVDGMDLPGRSTRLLVAPTAIQSRLLFERALDFHERLNGPVRKADLRRGPYPRFAHGEHEVLARSGKAPDHLRGMQADLVVVDEAAFVPESLATDVLAPMLATTDGRMALISTPNGHNWFWRMFETGRLGQHGFWSYRGPSSENPLVSPEFLERQRKLIRERSFETEYLALFQDVPGQVFREESIQACLSGDLAWDPRLPVGVGIDWGQAHDYTAVVVVQSQHVGYAVLECLQVRRTSWSEMVDLAACTAAAYRDGVAAMDATGTQSSVIEMATRALHPFRCLPVTFTPETKRELVERLAWAVETCRLRLPPHDALLEELRQFGIKPTSAGGWRYEARSGHDDLVVALALAIHALPSLGSRILLGPKRS